MAKCQSLKKYNLETQSWEEVKGEKERAFSIVKYNTEFGKSDKTVGNKFEYIILINGNRRENYSKTGKSGQCTGWGASNFLSVIDNYNAKIKVESILIDNDAPLEEQSKIVAKYINRLKQNKNCSKIHVLGISKCGCMSVALLKHLEDSYLDKLNIMAYSAPYLGTIYASPVSLYKRTDQIINNIPHVVSDKIVNLLQKAKPREVGITNIIKNVHWRLFSRSHMDYDISEINGDGVPIKHKNKYDKRFLKELFNEKTLEMLKKIKFTNITTYCTEETLRQAVLTKNVNAGMLYLSDKTIFAGKLSDGMVELASSRYIEEICNKNNINISKLKIPDGHHDICGDIQIIRRVIDEIIMCKQNEQYRA